MTLTGLFVDVGTAAADFNSSAAVALIGHHEPDAAVAMLVVVLGRLWKTRAIRAKIPM